MRGTFDIFVHIRAYIGLQNILEKQTCQVLPTRLLEFHTYKYIGTTLHSLLHEKNATT